MKRLLLLSLLISTGTASAAPLYQMFDIPQECPTPTNCACLPHLSSSLPPRSLVSEDFNVKKDDEPDFKGLMSLNEILSSSADKTGGLVYSFLQQNNSCDEVGTLYLAKFMAYFWPHTSEYKALDKAHQGLVSSLFKIAERGTFTIEGQTVPHCVLPQAKCIAEILRTQKRL